MAVFVLLKTSVLAENSLEEAQQHCPKKRGQLHSDGHKMHLHMPGHSSGAAPALPLEHQCLNTLASASSERCSRRLSKEDNLCVKNEHGSDEKTCLYIRAFFLKSQVPGEQKGYAILFRAVEAAYYFLHGNRIQEEEFDVSLAKKAREISLKGRKKYLNQGLYTFSQSHTNKPVITG